MYKFNLKFLSLDLEVEFEIGTLNDSRFIHCLTVKHNGYDVTEFFTYPMADEVYVNSTFEQEIFDRMAELEEENTERIWRIWLGGGEVTYANY